MALELWIVPAREDDCRALANPFVTPVRGLDGFLWAPYEQPCAKCGDPTTWVVIDFECRLHPGTCSEEMWDDYAWADALGRIWDQDWPAW